MLLVLLQQRCSLWILILVLFVLIPAVFSAAAFRIRKEGPILDQKKGQGPPNVIVILADDLGYGDTSVPPFTTPLFANLSVTPELLRMAHAGRIMTNFHVASPICSPARASIMTGLFPWRLGVDFIYAQDLKNDGSEELNHEQLPLIPNMAMSFRDNGYHTAHVGKWHLGGMRNAEIASRYQEYQQQQHALQNGTSSSSNACSAPGLLQYGYDEYVCMSEGNDDSDRFSTQQVGMTYKLGARYLVRNDVKLPVPTEDRWLTDAQTDEAMRVVREQTREKKPFFLNLWYDAPHSPWESVEPFFSSIANARKHLPTRLHKYMSMIANMDWNIGRLLRLVDQLGIAENTIIVFTSDNGPEINAGSGGPFQGGKRLLMEGGIRVPAIWQWKGVIPSNSSISTFGISTDIYPTLIHAAGLRMPSHVRIDGISFLPVLRNDELPVANQKGVNAKAASAPAFVPTSLTPNTHLPVAPTHVKTDANMTMANGDERIMLWYTHCPGFPKFTAAWAHGYKLVWNDYEGRQAKKLPPPLRFFDMRVDPTEQIDLIPKLMQYCDAYLKGSKHTSTTWESLESLLQEYLHNVHGTGKAKATLTMTAERGVGILTLANHLHIKAHLFRHIGNEDWLRYHMNKPYTVEKYCARRRSKVDTLTWGTVLPPEFCGDGISADAGSSNCHCSLSECSQNWFASDTNSSTPVTSFVGAASPSSQSRQGWSSGPVFAGLSAFAASGSSVHTALANILRWSNFQPLCAKDNNAQAGPTLNTKGSTNSPLPSSYASSTYQRVFRRDIRKKRSGGVYVTGSACVSESQALWQNIYGMHAPLALCPTSLLAMNPADPLIPAFDDNAFTFALNDILFGKSTGARSFRRSIPGAFDADVIKLGNRTFTLNDGGQMSPTQQQQQPQPNILEVAVIDSMYAFNLKHSSETSTDAGYFSHIMHRLHSGAEDILLVIPYLSEHGWGALCVFVPTARRGAKPRVLRKASTPHENTTPFSIYVQANELAPSMNVKMPSASYSDNQGMKEKFDISQFMYSAVLQTLRKARPYESEKWTEKAAPLTYLQTTVAGGFARTGMRIMLFANSLRQALERSLPLEQVLSSYALQKVLDQSAAVVDDITRKLASQYVQRSKQQLKRLEFDIRKATFLPK